MVENHHGAYFHMWCQSSSAYNLYIVGKEISSGLILPYRFHGRFHKMVKHTQVIRRQFADKLFEFVSLFCGIGA